MFLELDTTEYSVLKYPTDLDKMANKEILIDYFKGLPRTRLYEN
jgi:hypothetical protein